jgi:hypothetical protein
MNNNEKCSNLSGSGTNIARHKNKHRSEGRKTVIIILFSLLVLLSAMMNWMKRRMDQAK